MNGTMQLSEEQQRKKDSEQIKLLAIFHFVLSGMSLLGLGFIFLHYFLMSSFFANPEMWKSQPGGAALPLNLFKVFQWFYVFMGVLIVIVGVLNLLSGIFLL